MDQKKRLDVKTLVTLGVLSAISSVLMLVFRISIMPGNEFLIFDIKDIPIVIGGFLYGPLAIIPMSFVVSFVEMFTISRDGLVGFLMNVLSTCAFACPAAIIYKSRHSLSGAVIGLVAGALSVTTVMLMWNYIITPIYRGFPREVIVPMLSTVFLPFNLIKYGFGAAMVMLVYKPLSMALRKAQIIQEADNGPSTKQNIIAGIALALCLAVIPCVLLILVLNGVI